MIWNRTTGDVLDTIVAYLYGVTGTPSSSAAHVWATGSTATTLTSACVAGTDISGTACLVHTIQLGTWLTSLTVGATYNLEHQITFADGRTITWQGDGVKVGVQGA